MSHITMSRRHWGRRTVNYDNLFLSVAVVILSFVSYLYLLSPHGLLELPGADATSGDGLENAEHAYTYVLADGVPRVALPVVGPNVSSPIFGSFGLADATRKLTVFFARPLQSRMSMSDLYRRVLFRERFQNASHESIGGGNGTDFLTPLSVVHLCSATSCVGPISTLAFAHRTRAAAWRPMRVHALVYGDPAMACLVSEELRRNGVRVPAQVAMLSSAAAASTADVNAGQPDTRCANKMQVHLFGKLDAFTAAQNAVDGDVSVTAECSGGHCQYTPVRASTGVRQELLRQTNTAAPVVAIPLSNIEFVVRGEMSSTLPRGLHASPVDVVSMELDADDAVGVLAYLRGLATCLAAASSKKPAAPSHVQLRCYPPNSVVVRIHATEWAGEIFAAVDTLHDSFGYALVLLDCGERVDSCPSPQQIGDHRPAAGPPDAHLWSEVKRQFSGDALRAREQAHSNIVGAAGRRVAAIEPPVAVLLTREVRLLDTVMGLSTQSLEVQESKSSSVNRAAKVFFSPHLDDEPAPPGTRNEAVWHCDLDSSTDKDTYPAPESQMIGKHVYRVASTLIKAFLYALPVAICVFLLYNLSKAWRRRT